MAKTVKPDNIWAAIEEELKLYHEDVLDKVDRLSEEAAKELVKKTKATAPKGKRGSFKKNIASKRLFKNSRGSTYVWYVKAPDYRLTHLLVHGHATKDGGRARGSYFLHNALNEVLPKYEKNVKEAIQNGK